MIYNILSITVDSYEGYVTIVDRMDDKIITGVENVYSIEVEDLLYSHPSILEGTVIGLPEQLPKTGSAKVYKYKLREIYGKKAK